MKTLSITTISLACLASSLEYASAENFLADVADYGGGLRQRSLVALDISGIGLCSKGQPCGRCEGDCHRDEDCAGNLVCYNVAGRHKPGDFCAKIPGCSGEDLSKTDWCIRPEDMPVPNLCDTRAEVESHENNGNNDSGKDTNTPVIIETSNCDDLESLVFDMTTKINDVDTETLRYQILTQELAMTANMADPFATERRSLTTKTSTVVDGESSLEKLALQQQRLSEGNGQVTEINSSIRDFVNVWRDENGLLSGRVNDLSLENASLQAERDDLAIQISDLNANVNELQALVGAHGDLNEELDSSVSDLEAEINRLQAENERYQDLNQEFEDRIQDLQTEVGNLKEENAEFARLNDVLEAAQERLDEQVKDLADQNTELEENVENLESAVDRLANETNRLEITNDDLEQTVEVLEGEVDTLESNVNRLEDLNTQLETIVSFVNETGVGITESYEQVAAFLAEQIDGYRLVATETLQNTYIQRVDLWDCAYRDTFGDYDFAFDGLLEIPEQDIDGGVFDQVIGYVNDRVLSELCLDILDFEEYLEVTFKEPVYTSNYIVSGITSYTTEAFNYYFPDASEVGLTLDDWALAGYDCKGLSSDKQFSFKK